MGSNAVWCSNCAISLRPHVTHDAKLCCSFCGKVVAECNWSEEVISSNYADQQYKRKSGTPGTDGDENMHSREDDKTGGTTKHVASKDSDFDDSLGSNKISSESGEELDTFSDIDDLEIDSYVHSEKEQQYKKIIWEELNREFIEKQLAKQAAAAAAEEAYKVYMRNSSEGMDVGQKLNAAETETESRKGRRPKQAKEARNLVIPRIIMEGTRQMLAKKTLESKINHAALDELFNESLSPQDAKTSRFGEGAAKAKR